MAVRIVEEALRGNISGKVMAVVANEDLGTGYRRGERQLWHVNMPNIRIAFMISQFRYDLDARVFEHEP
jgi:hypothetical protein